MYSGVVAEYAKIDTIFQHPLHPYTQELLKAFPDQTDPKAKIHPSYPPRLDNLPKGCRFSPRCPKAFERCFEEQLLPLKLRQDTTRAVI